MELTPVDKERRIDALKEHMLQLPQVDLSLQHSFAPGLYMRTITIPAGALVVGHYHRFECLNIMMSGKISVFVDGEVKTLEGHNVIVSKPGRKVAYAHEETVWANVIPTDETDIDTIEDLFVDKNYSAEQLEHEVIAMIEHVGVEA